MERVQEAITKARAERQGVIGRRQFKKPGAKVSAYSGVEQSADEVYAKQIEYTQTQIKNSDSESLKENRVIAGFNHDKRVEVYRRLRSQVLMKLRDNNWNTLAVTSPGENAGKTHIAINLAISLAQEVNQTVMLVDLDLRSPSVNDAFDIEVEKGISDCLLNDEPVENVLINPGINRLVLLPARSLNQYSSELLTAPKMREIVADITSRYSSRIIIFDLPPLLRNDDALVFAPQADATLMVVEEGVSSKEDIKRCMHLLKDSNPIGTILNKARV